MYGKFYFDKRIVNKSPLEHAISSLPLLGEAKEPLDDTTLLEYVVDQGSESYLITPSPQTLLKGYVFLTKDGNQISFPQASFDLQKGMTLEFSLGRGDVPLDFSFEYLKVNIITRLKTRIGILRGSKKDKEIAEQMGIDTGRFSHIFSKGSDLSYRTAEKYALNLGVIQKEEVIDYKKAIERLEKAVGHKFSRRKEAARVCGTHASTLSAVLKHRTVLSFEKVSEFTRRMGLSEVDIFWRGSEPFIPENYDLVIIPYKE